MLNGRLYTVYQVNEQGAGFFDTTFRNPGEIWLVDLGSEPVRQWRIAPTGTARVSEPEPLVIGERVWIFYSQLAAEEQDLAESAPRRGIGALHRMGKRGESHGLKRFGLYRVELSPEF